jgi:hypothetical protein
MDIRLLGPGDEDLLVRERGWAGMYVFTNAGNTAAMRLYESAGGVRPNPDDVMFDFYE